MLRKFAALALLLALTGCAPALIAIPAAISIAKDVLEIDVTAKQLFAPPPAPPAGDQ
jgi:hypothetical protein